MENDEKGERDVLLCKLWSKAGTVSEDLSPMSHSGN